MVRGSAKNHANVAVVVSPDRYPEVIAARRRRRVHAGPAPAAGRRGVRPHRVVRRRRRGLDGQRPDAGRRTGRGSRTGPARRGTSERTCATARTRTRPPRSTRTGGPGVAQAERAARQGDVLQQLRRHRRGRAVRRSTSTQPAVAIIKHANPCGIAVGADIAEAHAQGARVRPGLGVRRRRSPRTGRCPCAMAEPAGRDLHRGRGRAGVRRRRLELLSQKKNIRLLELPADTAPDPVEFRADLAAACCCRPCDRVDAVVRRRGHRGRR